MRPGILLLAYGGPDSLDDIPAYLLDIRGGRETPEALVHEIRERYALIGGRSPLLSITQSAAARLQVATGLPVFVGMRHWRPTIPEAVAEIAAAGVDPLVVICMAPHYSAMSIGAYRRKLDEALAAAGLDLDVRFISDWHLQPDFLDALAAHVAATLRRFGDADVLVVFTAHSLPAALIAQGDPYDAQLHQTAAALADRLQLPAARWRFCYQSAAQTGVPWLGPQIEELVPELAAQGERNLLIAPIGFIADHVEVLYDLDIGVQAIARRHGVRVERPPMLNDGDGLVAALAALTRSALTAGAGAAAPVRERQP
jgi:ferrochelatase